MLPDDSGRLRELTATLSSLEFRNGVHRLVLHEHEEHTRHSAGRALGPPRRPARALERAGALALALIGLLGGLS